MPNTSFTPPQRTNDLLAGKILDEYRDLLDAPQKLASRGDQTATCPGEKGCTPKPRPDQTPTCPGEKGCPSKPGPVQTPTCVGAKGCGPKPQADQTPTCPGERDCPTGNGCQNHPAGQHPKKAMSWIDPPRA
jgi:hypothetical protein